MSTNPSRESYVSVRLLMDVLARIHAAARARPRHVVLPEGTEPRTVAAAAKVASLGLAQVTLLGPPDEIGAVASAAGVTLSGVSLAAVPAGREADAAVRAYLERAARRGVTPDEARAQL